MTKPFPEPVEVLSSGMLLPKKSLLAIVGLTARDDRHLNLAGLVPCAACSFSPCQYRRVPYRNAPLLTGTFPPPAVHGTPVAPVAPLARDAKYSVNGRALKKWAQERV